MENALQEVEGKTKKEIAVKSQRVMSKWLDLPMQYRDPVKAGLAPRRQAIPSGEAND